MDEQWGSIERAVTSNDPDRVNDAIARLEGLSADEVDGLWPDGFDRLRDEFADAEDGYVRQSLVRAVEAITPGLAVAVTSVEAGGDDGWPVETLRGRNDAARDLLVEALGDSDGRVRQSARRAMKDVHRVYEVCGAEAEIAAVAEELAALAEEASGTRRDHLLDATADAEFFARPGGDRLVDALRELVERSGGP